MGGNVMHCLIQIYWALEAGCFTVIIGYVNKVSNYLKCIIKYFYRTHRMPLRSYYCVQNFSCEHAHVT